MGDDPLPSPSRWGQAPRRRRTGWAGIGSLQAVVFARRFMRRSSAMASEHRVVSADGTRIGCSKSGSGPPLVFVHGTGTDRSSVRFIEPLLAERFTVYAVDRRGRGLSGDSGGEYLIDQEFADIAAVVDSLGEPADLFGHSYGATVALGSAPLARNLRRLILYEPAPGIPSDTTGLPAKLDALLAQDRREEALSVFMREVAGLTADALDRLRASPVWTQRVAAAHTIPREIRAEESYVPDPDTFAALSIPVMLITGSESPDWAMRGTKLAGSLCPGSRIVTLQGQGHVALMTAPELLVAEVTHFLHEA